MGFVNIILIIRGYKTVYMPQIKPDTFQIEQFCDR